MKIIYVHYVYLTLYLCVSGCRYGFFCFVLFNPSHRGQETPKVSIHLLHSCGGSCDVARRVWHSPGEK
jgi:hypothetical protein